MTVPSPLSTCAPHAGECHICGDEAVVGRVIDIDESNGTGTVEFGEASATVALDLVDARVGDEVLVHLGFAIERVTGT